MQIQAISTEVVNAEISPIAPKDQDGTPENGGLFGILLAMLQGGTPVAPPVPQGKMADNAAAAANDFAQLLGNVAPVAPTPLSEAANTTSTTLPVGTVQTSNVNAAIPSNLPIANSDGLVVVVPAEIPQGPESPASFILPQAFQAPVKSTAALVVESPAVSDDANEDVPTPVPTENVERQSAPQANATQVAKPDLAWLVSKAKFTRLARTGASAVEPAVVPPESATLSADAAMLPETAVSAGLADMAERGTLKSSAEFVVQAATPVTAGKEVARLERAKADSSLDISTWQNRLDPARPESLPAAATGKADSPADPRMMRPTIDTVNDFAIKSVRYLLKDNAQSIHVKLVPESLGELRIAVTSVNDVVQIHMAASNSTVRELLQHQQQSLRDSFARDGIEVSNIVFTSDTSSGSGMQSFVGRDQTPLDGWQRSLTPAQQRTADSGNTLVPARRQFAHAGTLDLWA